MIKGRKYRKRKDKKNPGRLQREQHKEETSILRGERIPGTRVIPDKRNNEKEKRLKKEAAQSQE